MLALVLWLEMCPQSSSYDGADCGWRNSVFRSQLLSVSAPSWCGEDVSHGHFGENRPWVTFSLHIPTPSAFSIGSVGRIVAVVQMRRVATRRVVTVVADVADWLADEQAVGVPVCVVPRAVMVVAAVTDLHSGSWWLSSPRVRPAGVRATAAVNSAPEVSRRIPSHK